MPCRKVCRASSLQFSILLAAWALRLRKAVYVCSSRCPIILRGGRVRPVCDAGGELVRPLPQARLRAIDVILVTAVGARQRISTQQAEQPDADQRGPGAGAVGLTGYARPEFQRPPGRRWLTQRPAPAQLFMRAPDRALDRLIGVSLRPRVHEGDASAGMASGRSSRDTGR